MAAPKKEKPGPLEYMRLAKTSDVGPAGSDAGESNTTLFAGQGSLR